MKLKKLYTNKLIEALESVNKFILNFTKNRITNTFYQKADKSFKLH